MLFEIEKNNLKIAAIVPYYKKPTTSYDLVENYLVVSGFDYAKQHIVR